MLIVSLVVGCELAARNGNGCVVGAAVGYGDGRGRVVVLQFGTVEMDVVVPLCARVVADGGYQRVVVGWL